MTRETNPIRHLEHQLERLQGQLETALGSLDVDSFESVGSGPQIGIDIADTGEAFEVTADVPGFDRDTIEVHVAGDTLHIAARSEDTETERSDGEYLRSERRRRSVSRSITLPEPVDEGETTATYHNGVVTVTLPKADDGGGTSIDIS